MCWTVFDLFPQTAHVESVAVYGEVSTWLRVYADKRRYCYPSTFFFLLFFSSFSPSLSHLSPVAWFFLKLPCSFSNHTRFSSNSCPSSCARDVYDVS